MDTPGGKRWSEGVVWVKDNMPRDADVRLSCNDDLDFRRTEVKRLTNVAKLSKLWGYRSGPDQQHEHFELRSHDIYWVQGLTDPIFRVLQQMRMHPGDGFEKLNGFRISLDFLEDDVQVHEARKLLRSFLKNQEARTLMCQLASYHLQSTCSRAFVYVVTAARVLLLFTIGRAKRARALLNTVVNL